MRGLRQIPVISHIRETGALLGHTDTVSVARDHEALRIALGVRQVSWLGLSDDLVARADQQPIPVGGAMRPVTGEDIRMGTVGLLRFKEPSIYGPDLSWAGLSRALARALDGDAAAFALPPLGVPQDGLFTLLSIGCMEYVPQIDTYGEMRQRIQMARQLAPHLQGASETWQVNRCIGWPVPVANPPRLLDVRGVPTPRTTPRRAPVPR